MTFFKQIIRILFKFIQIKSQKYHYFAEIKNIHYFCSEKFKKNSKNDSNTPSPFIKI